MKNNELAAVFAEIADLLEIKGAQSFRVSSYRRVGRTVKDLPEDIAEVADRGELASVQGIGKSSAEKIQEFLETGRIAMHGELLDDVPNGLLDLLRIPGMGPKKVALAWKELGVTGMDDLKRVIASGELASIKGMGKKSVEQIVSGIAFAERSTGRTALGMALPLAEELAEFMRSVPGVVRVEVGGSLRRGCETIGDLDLLCESDNGEAVVAAFTGMRQAQRVLASGGTKGSIVVERRDGQSIQVDCRVVPTESFGAALQYFTGSKEHNVKLREMASKKGWKLNEWGLFDGENQIAGADEASIYDKLGMPLIPPSLREDQGEFAVDAFEDLIELSDIRGDLHMHTRESDGTTDAETMAAAAEKLGYEYIAITDHSKSSVVANGLSVDRMWEQIERIRSLNEELQTISVLVGCECDILTDGELDYPDTVLAACDFVVASVHQGMNQDRAKLTARILKAIENPYVSVLGHPTGRLINRREPMDFDVAAVIQRAAETGTALEINAAWQRLDLKDIHLRMAVDAGAMISMNTDSHSVAQLDQMKLGIITARRGWVCPRHVINTMPLPSLRQWIAQKRGEG